MPDEERAGSLRQVPMKAGSDSLKMNGILVGGLEHGAIIFHNMAVCQNQ